MKYTVLITFLLNCNSFYSIGAASLEYSHLEKDEGVRYSTYTRKTNQNNPVDIREAQFNNSVGNVFLIHDYKVDKYDRTIKLKNDLFQYDPNVGTVTIIDWMGYSLETDSASFADHHEAPNSFYKVAYHHVPLLAQDLRDKLIYLRENGGKIIELIGHGVGAHIAGQAGKLLSKSTGYEVDKIVGLDPVGLFFDKNPKLALQYSDAETTIVIHTNINVYGFNAKIGPDDKYINGGNKQPNCNSKLTEDFCSHNEAWTVYSKYLRDGLVSEIDQHDSRTHPYVLCLDVSISMNEGNRWTRAIQAMRKNIFNMNSDSYMGIVAFNETAVTVHDIVHIRSRIEKEYLNHSLPNSPDGGTSIGSGLRRSLNLLQAMPNTKKICSTIILISDGEDNTDENGRSGTEIPLPVVDDIQKACISVNSIALGAKASKKLENISEATFGTVSFAMEDGGNQQISGITHAISFSIESEMDPDDRPIYLPSKEVSVSDGESSVIHYNIDETIGEDTEFSFQSNYVDKIDVRLASPDDETYDVSSTEFFDGSNEKGFHIKSAQPGQWNLTITKASSRKRRSLRSISGGIAAAKTHRKVGKISTIRLEASVSNRSLEYPDSITVSAELRIGEFPIIDANIFAIIQGPNQQFIRLPLYDNGVFPDDAANDGVYKNDVIKLPELGRYLLFVRAESKNTTKFIPKKINYFLRDGDDCRNVRCENTKSFEREVNVGSIKLVSKLNEDKIVPKPVKNLRARVENKAKHLIALEYISPVDEIFNIEIKSYDIRALINDTQFENGFQFSESDVIKGSLNVTNSTKTKEERIVLKIPDHIWKFVKENVRPLHWPEIKFALKSIAASGASSDRSNTASVIFKEKLMSILEHKIDVGKTVPGKRKECRTTLLNSQFGMIRYRVC